MAKYVIQCLEVVPCMVVVEAPSREAAESFYEMCDGSEFERSPPVEDVGPPSLKEIGFGPGGMYSLQKGTPFIGNVVRKITKPVDDLPQGILDSREDVRTISNSYSEHYNLCGWGADAGKAGPPKGGSV